VTAELSGRNDLLAEGRKFSGNAQHTKNSRTLHHGTLLYNSDLAVLSSVLNVDEDKIRSKGIKSARSRVINLSELIGTQNDVQDFIELIGKFVEKKYGVLREDAPTNEIIDALYRRNSSSEWIFPDRELVSRYSLRKKIRYDFGIVDIYLDMSNDTVKDIKISGDFFGNAPIVELEGLIVGNKFDSLAGVLEGFDVARYIFGMNSDMLIAHIIK
jgi:lipoate-protein ligase A